LKPRNGFHNFRRLIYGGLENGVEDIEVLGFAPGFFEFGCRDGSKRSALGLFTELLTPEGNKADSVYSKFFLPYEARFIFEKLKGATDRDAFVRALDPVFNIKGSQERKSVFYIVLYPETDFLWCDAQIIDFCSFYLSGIPRLLENGYYFINIAKEYEKAKYYYHEAEKLEPESFYISAQLGWAYLATGDFPNAFKYLKAAESLDIESADGTYLFNLGLYFLVQADEDSAICFYNKALNAKSWKELLPLAIEDINYFVERGWVAEKISTPILQNLEKLQKGCADRNDNCPCWSGKKYKRCHGKA
jgi:tetratricopeptide (TPR) repeat protein